MTQIGRWGQVRWHQALRSDTIIESLSSQKEEWMNVWKIEWARAVIEDVSIARVHTFL